MLVSCDDNSFLQVNRTQYSHSNNVAQMIWIGIWSNFMVLISPITQQQ